MKKSKVKLQEWGRARHPTHRKERDEWGTRFLLTLKISYSTVTDFARFLG
jgi:hypothetical protein